VITNGYGVMYSYASRVQQPDRWAIAAYIRALQAARPEVPLDQYEQERLRAREKARHTGDLRPVEPEPPPAGGAAAAGPPAAREETSPAPESGAAPPGPGPAPRRTPGTTTIAPPRNPGDAPPAPATRP